MSESQSKNRDDFHSKLLAVNDLKRKKLGET